MKALWGGLAFLVILGIGVLMGRLAFPPRVVTQPHIVTHWDTVERVVPRLDTVWRTRVVSRVETLPNVVDTVTVQSAPETVTVTLRAVCPQSLQVGQYSDRSRPTIIEGRTFDYDSTRTLLTSPWRVTYYTPGPLDAMVADTFPPVVSFRSPPKECGFWCRLGYVGLGAVVGAGATGAACVVSHVAR